MDLSFWAGVVITTVLGLPVAIIANLYSDPVREYLDRRKALKLNNKLAVELATYRKVLRLVQGDPRETLLLGEARFMSTLCVLLLFLGYTLMALLLYAKIKHFAFAPSYLITAVASFCIVCLLFVTFTFFMFFHEHNRLLRRVRRFAEYQQQIRNTFGEDAI